MRMGIPALLLILLAVALVAEAGGDWPVDTTIMSFNIRYAGAGDGENSWENRRYLVRRAIREHKPAIFGLQECLWDEGVELAEAFYGYRITGVGREDGVRKGEMCLIFTRIERYHVLDEGHFWLSETPDVPGSMGWDAACTRMVTWVKLRDRRCNPDTLFVFNTHFDHVGEVAREQSARLVQQRVAELAAGYPVILMGDFNTPAGPESAPYRILAEEGYKVDVALRDAYFFADKEERLLDPGTYHGFTGRPSTGRIDWILCSGEFEGVAAGIERWHKDGRYPSDHFPVWVTFRQETHPPLPGDEVDGSTGATPRY